MYFVVYMHPELSREDLDAYILDGVRTPAMLALHPDVVVSGEFFRSTKTPDPPGMLSSWASNRKDAASFGGEVRTTERLAIVAAINHDDYGHWTEYVGVPL